MAAGTKAAPAAMTSTRVVTSGLRAPRGRHLLLLPETHRLNSNGARQQQRGNGEGLVGVGVNNRGAQRLVRLLPGEPKLSNRQEFVS